MKRTLSQACDRYLVGATSEYLALNCDSDSNDAVWEHSVPDFVVTVTADFTLAELQNRLAEVRQCLPIGCFHAEIETLRDLIALNLPHSLQLRWGSWRDWILGCQLRTAQDEVVKCGSKVVKSVAGYDIHRFIVGSRESFGNLMTLTLRTFPLISLPSDPAVSWEVLWGVPPSCVGLVSSEYVVASAPDAGLFWCRKQEVLTRFEGDWMLDLNGEMELDSCTKRRMSDLKKSLDPAAVLNPGVWGFL